MTKSVRIENADTSIYKVKVKIQTKDVTGEWVDSTEPEVSLDHPTSLATFGIHSSRRLIVEEA